MMTIRALAVATAFVFPSVAAAQTASPDAPAAAVAVLTSAAQPFADTLVLRGRTEANRSVDVPSEIAGLVASEPLPKGALVRAGDTLCQIRTGDREAEMTEAKARLIEAETEFELDNAS